MFGARGHDDLGRTEQLVADAVAAPHLARHRTRLHPPGGHGGDGLVQLGIERPSDALHRLGAGLAQGTGEQAMRGGDALVEIAIGGAGGECALQGVEHREEREQRRPATLPPGGLNLLRGTPPEILEVRPQTKMAPLLFLERAAQSLDVLGTVRPIEALGLGRAHSISWPCAGRARRCR